MSNPSMTVAWLTWRQLFANRRLYLALAFSLAPVAITLLFKQFSANPANEAHGFYLTMEREIVVGTLLPIAALVFGTTAFGGEIDDGTLLYLFVKPIARWRVVIAKYVVAALSTCVLMLPAVYLPWLLLRAPELPAGLPFAFIQGAILGGVLYSALFVLLGLSFRQSLVIGLVYVVGFEGVLTRAVVGFKSLSVREFANTTTAAVADSTLKLGDPVVSTLTVKVVGAILLFGGLALAVWKLWKYEVAERL